MCSRVTSEISCLLSSKGNFWRHSKWVSIINRVFSCPVKAAVLGQKKTVYTQLTYGMNTECSVLGSPQTIHNPTKGNFYYCTVALCLFKTINGINLHIHNLCF